METRQRESLRAPGSSEISGTHIEAEPHRTSEPDDGQDTAGRGFGGGGRGTVEVGPPSALVGLAPY